MARHQRFEMLASRPIKTVHAAAVSAAGTKPLPASQMESRLRPDHPSGWSFHRPRRGIPGVVFAGTSIFAATAQQLEAIADDLGSVAFHAFAVGILLRLYPALDVDLTPFAKILTGNLGLTIKEGYPMTFRAFLGIAFSVLVTLGRCQTIKLAMAVPLGV